MGYNTTLRPADIWQHDSGLRDWEWSWDCSVRRYAGWSVCFRSQDHQKPNCGLKLEGLRNYLFIRRNLDFRFLRSHQYSEVRASSLAWGRLATIPYWVVTLPRLTSQGRGGGAMCRQYWPARSARTSSRRVRVSNFRAFDRWIRQNTVSEDPANSSSSAIPVFFCVWKKSGWTLATLKAQPRQASSKHN